jgi:hypothetical protein
MQIGDNAPGERYAYVGVHVLARLRIGEHFSMSGHRSWNRLR